MDFRYPPEAEAFRAEFRAWLDANLPDELRGRGLGGRSRSRTPRSTQLRAWNRTLADARYAAIAWPEEWGGRGAGRHGAGRVLARRCTARTRRARSTRSACRTSRPRSSSTAPTSRSGRCSPACCAATTSGARASPSPTPAPTSRRCARRPCATATAGSSTGRRPGTRSATSPNWCELLVRTDPDVPKHKGITCLLVDMTLPGVEVRPLVTITGDKEFNEIFFTDVRVPVDCTLGPVNEGWRVAMTTLAYERGTVAKLHTGTRGKIARLIDEARTTPLGDGRMASDDPVLREKLAARLPRRRAAQAHLRPRALGRAARPGHGPRRQHRQARVERDRAAPDRARRRTCSAPTR